MKATKLSLEQALRLAFIISKYIDIETDLEKSAFEFMEDVAQKVPPDEYLVCISIITNEDIQKIIKADAVDIIALLTEGFILNNITTLLSFCKKLKNGSPK